METELKFQVPADRSAAVQRAVATATAVQERLQARYFDTLDHKLAKAGLALRMRKEGRVWVQALKGRGDGLMQRLEHEVTLPAVRGEPAIDPTRHAGTPVGDQLLKLLDRLAPAGPTGRAAGLPNDPAGGALPASARLLTVIYRTDIQRCHRRVRHGGALIDIAHDRGRISAEGRTLAVDELEFELVSGPATALPELARRWAQKHGLWWDLRTKSERGMRLALGELVASPAKSPRATWKPDASGIARVWSETVQSALQQALANAAELGSGQGDSEHLHQLRVALRRLRTALRVLGPWSSHAQAVATLESDWRDPFVALGAARDADVHDQGLRPALLAAGCPSFDWPADADASDPGDVVRGAAFTDLALRTLVLAVAAAPADSPPSQSGSTAAGPGVPRDDFGTSAEAERVRTAADQVLRKAWKAALQDAGQFEYTTVESQHRTRKRLKRFRYAFEFLLPLYDGKPARRLLRAVSRALDAMGELNDLQGAEAALRARAEIDPRAWFAVGWLAARRQPLLKDALLSLTRLDRAPQPWRQDRRG